MNNNNSILKFYNKKRIIITGHTGFKGSWLTTVLLNAGANVYGYALNPPTTPSLFNLCGLEKEIESYIGDIRDLDKLSKCISEVKPDIIIHMAAQPIVRESYQNPVYTYDVNVMGTVNILECARQCNSIRSIVNVTTDKVYLNKEWSWAYRENEELNGFDPYSNSKSCSELITSCYKNSFFNNKSIAISTARAGNVIGGGDFASDRILPDCLRAIINKEEIRVRNPLSIRPYQHVLEPIMAYLMIAKEQFDNCDISGSFNVGPQDIDCWNTGHLVDEFCKQWNKTANETIKWKSVTNNGPHEANFLKLDCSKINEIFGWKAKWTLDTAIEKVVEWDMDYINKKNLRSCLERQIEEYIGEHK